MSPSQPRKRVESAHKCKRPGGAQTPRGRHQEVSPDATPTLQALAFAARVQREAMKDKSYRSTPIGLEVGRDYRWKKNEWGATAETMCDYEAILGKLALDHADLEVSSFKPPVGTELLREFIDNRWGERTARTRAKVISVLPHFFGWAVREGRLHGNPALPIFRPRRRDVARGTFTEGDVRKLLTSQPRLRDCVALLLLFRLGLRKSELARVQFAHYDGRNLTVFGKGGKARYLPVVDRQLREARAAHPRARPDARRVPALPGEDRPGVLQGAPSAQSGRTGASSCHPLRCIAGGRAAWSERDCLTGRSTRLATRRLRRSCGAAGTSNWRSCSPAMPTSAPPRTSTHTLTQATSRRRSKR